MMIWANLIHLSMNMWGDHVRPEGMANDDPFFFREKLQFEDDCWEELLARMVAAGVNTVVIDLGDGVRYESHPEIAVKGAWTRAKLRRELKKMRRMGLEPIPKLNFSCCHDAWMGPYSRMVSTDVYYAVCRDLIAEVADLFDRPRFFHLGMDEETFNHQRKRRYVVVRQYDLWWHDLLFYVREVERAGVRAWVWSDYIWHHHDEFLSTMPRSVVQSNWYYDLSFGPKSKYVAPFLDLDRNGYEQIPTGSNWAAADNFERLVSFCARRIAPERLLGFMQTSWKPTVKEYRRVHLDAIEKLAAARAALEKHAR
ncbi:MAG: Tat pathway signal protein [Armatimonadota bacterium]